MKYCLAPLLVAAALLNLTGCNQSKQTGASVTPAFQGTVSPDAQTLFSVKLDKLKTSEIYKRHKQQLDVPQLNAMSERAGLDPRRDLSDILLVWDGKHLLLLAQGEFLATHVEAKAVAGGARRVPYKSFTLFTTGGDSVSFPVRGLAIASSTAGVQAALDLRSSRGGSIPPELKERLAEIPADAQMWVVSRSGLPGANFPLPPNIDSALSNIAVFVSGTSLGVRFDSGSHLQARVICKSAEGAQRVRDTMRGLIGLARLTTKDNELDLLRMWDAVSVSNDQDSVRVQADLPADLTDKLIAQLMTFRGRASGLLRPR